MGKTYIRIYIPFLQEICIFPRQTGSTLGARKESRGLSSCGDGASELGDRTNDTGTGHFRGYGCD